MHKQVFSDVMPAGFSSSPKTFLGCLFYQLHHIMTLQQQLFTETTTAPRKQHMHCGHLQIVSQQVHVICCLLFPYLSINKPVDYVKCDDARDGVSCIVFRKQIMAVIRQDVGTMAVDIATHLKTVTECIQSFESSRFNVLGDGVGRGATKFSALDVDENIDMLRLLTEYLEQVVAPHPHA